MDPQSFLDWVCAAESGLETMQSRLQATTQKAQALASELDVPLDAMLPPLQGPAGAQQCSAMADATRATHDLAAVQGECISRFYSQKS